ncbi:response regulator [Dyadobacter luticola]|uniref:response regulator n=1 Tax=Dyadobacter luticola TaxID=1979387 RepID=UPI0014862E4B|nr:response regulator [Dyadobacter luticola]
MENILADPKSIYIVDDDEDDIFLIRQAISELKLDVAVFQASNGRDLLDILDKNKQNALILIDMNMPIMNGIETLNAIYADPDFQHFRSILVSTSDAEKLRELALRSGASEFLSKPVYYQGYIKMVAEIFFKYF